MGDRGQIISDFPVQLSLLCFSFFSVLVPLNHFFPFVTPPINILLNVITKYVMGIVESLSRVTFFADLLLVLSAEKVFNLTF